jgi:hypothetical protein
MKQLRGLLCAGLMALALMTPRPASADPMNWGSNGAAYLFNTIPDTPTFSGSIATTGTFEVVAGTAGQNTYIFYSGFQSGGTNSGLTLQPEYGQGATCGTNTQLIYPFATAGAAPASGTFMALWASSAAAASAAPVSSAAIASVPLFIPAGYNYCVVVGGATVNGKFVTYLATHVN